MQKIEGEIAGASGMSIAQHTAAQRVLVDVIQLQQHLLECGLVLTVEQVSVEPLRMGNYKHVITLRPSHRSNT